jgi:segregation and condensation protein B
MSKTIRAANPGDEPIEVTRNHGKPTKAAEIAATLAASTGRKPKAGKAKGGAPPNEPPMTPISPNVPSAQSAVTQAASVDDGARRSPKTTRPKAAQLRFLGMKPVHVVEAALFAAGKPILVDEIVEMTGLRPDDVKAGLQELAKEYAARDTVLEVGKAGAKWAMQVKSLASEPAAKFAPMEIPAKTLKTLALIAFHQPLKQSVLVDMVGSKAYDHVHELHERGLVKTREEGVTKLLTTTALFPEYFGLDAENPEEIRATMAKLVGIDPASLAKPADPSMTYEEPQSGPSADASAAPPAEAVAEAAPTTQ